MARDYQAALEEVVIERDALRAELEQLREEVQLQRAWRAGHELQRAEVDAVLDENERLRSLQMASQPGVDVGRFVDLIAERDHFGIESAKYQDRALKAEAEVERLRVLHKIDTEENEGLAESFQGWAKSNAKLRADLDQARAEVTSAWKHHAITQSERDEYRALVAELVEALLRMEKIDHLRNQCGLSTFVASDLIARARAALGGET